MLHNTKAIVLRHVRYGDSSIIVNMLTEQFGIQGYMVSGVRKSGKGAGKAGLLQPGVLLDIVSDQKPQKNLLRLKEFSPAYYYQHLPEDMVRNSVALFAVELLYRLLPERAPMHNVFQFSFLFLQLLDTCSERNVAYLPLYFATRIGSLSGFDLFDAATHQLSADLHLSEQEGIYLKQVVTHESVDELYHLQIPSSTRRQLLHNYLFFLQQQSQHMGTLKSLSILETILH